MELTSVVQQFHRHLGCTQTRGIVQAVVADRIETGTDDNRWRQAVQVGVTAWRIPRVKQVQCAERGGEGLLNPLNGLISQQGTAVRVLRVGGELVHQLSGRVHQHLQAQCRPAAAHVFLGDGSAEIAACRITANGQTSGIDTQLSSLFSHPFERSEGIGTAC
ncbi:hypothetical protein D3C78_1302120 [compost metagenome]